MKENIYAEEKTNHKMEIIAENEHMHTHTGGESKENHFPHHRLSPILTIHP